MFGAGLIVFRETLEAALFVGIVAASTKGVPERTRWLALGVGIGIVGSLLMASGMEKISAWANGIGQDLVTAGILSVALLMLAWHCIWVSPNAREMVAEAHQHGVSVTSGSSTLWALTTAVALAVLREGAETVLFVAGLVSGSNEGAGALVLSVLVGLSLGAVVGWLIYAGLGRVKPHRLFAITNALILLLAGSLASQLARILNQADWLPILGDKAWDISALLPNNSLLGAVLHGVLGYDASPSQLQLLFYLGATGSIWLAARYLTTRARHRLDQARPIP